MLYYKMRKLKLNADIPNCLKFKVLGKDRNDVFNESILQDYSITKNNKWTVNQLNLLFKC